MRIWLLRNGAEDGTAGLEGLLRQWIGQAAGGPWALDLRPLSPDLVSEVRAGQPEVLVLAEPNCPAGPWTADVLSQGVGLVVATEVARAEAYRALAEQFPIHLVALTPRVECLGLALLSARASLRRHLFWKAQADQLQQRLQDRILIERAKGILVQRLGISEEEAYKRLRLLSRRQRRQIRDIAQSLLDTQALLQPPTGNGFASHAEHDDWTEIARRSHPAPDPSSEPSTFPP
jgi:hypothetical protein